MLRSPSPSTTHAMLKQDDAWLDRIAPHTLLPSQLVGRARSAAERDGVSRLMLAVLENAVHDYLTFATATDRRRCRLFFEARAWFESADASWPFAFETVCATLGLDSDYLRRGLRARAELRRAGTPPAAGVSALPDVSHAA